MTKRNTFLLGALSLIFAGGSAVLAQKPAINVDDTRHPNIAAAQRHISAAWGSVDEAQRANKEELGGHAEKAKQLLDQASHELKEAADYADQHHK